MAPDTTRADTYVRPFEGPNRIRALPPSEIPAVMKFSTLLTQIDTIHSAHSCSSIQQSGSASSPVSQLSPKPLFHFVAP
jgi:hypothetical protein